jgi:hypothetical protein
MRLLAVLAVASLAVPAVAQDQVTFRILDRVGATEVEESTTVYIDQQKIGTFNLNAANNHGAFTVTIPHAASYRYSLCGTVVTQAPDGTTTTHRVDTTGLLTDVDGRTFEALTTDYTRYYVADETPDRAPAVVKIEQGHGCAPEISMR